MTHKVKQYWIHGNGLSSKSLPAGVLGDDLYGHGDSSWSLSHYSLEKLVKYFTQKVPKDCHIIGHSLGGHIAINVALARPDVTVTALGMVPANTLEEAFAAIKPTAEFQAFASSKRTYQDLVNLVKLYTQDLTSQARFLDSMVKQDPLFSETLFSKGFENYNWDERNKVKELGEKRFKLVINNLDPLINSDIAQSLTLNKVIRPHFGHCPWTPRCQVNKQNQEQPLQL